jgi:ATP-dependent DNA helicase RecG
MVIESAERFGLSQLHQLRGRVGRGADQSYCVLMTGNKLSEDTKLRMETMVRTNDGFEIAEVDLQLRGPGDLSGTQQSGVLQLKIADLMRDQQMMAAARNIANEWLAEDPEMRSSDSEIILRELANQRMKKKDWSGIS